MRIDETSELTELKCESREKRQKRLRKIYVEQGSTTVYVLSCRTDVHFH